MKRLLKALDKAGFVVVDHGDDGYFISAETGDYRVDYWRDSQTPELDAITHKYGYEADWYNAGELKLYKI